MVIMLGTAPDSWGVWFPDDPKQTPWQRFLDEVVEAGYTWIEQGPYGYLPPDPDLIRREVDRRGLKIAGGTFGGALHKPSERAGLEEQVRQVGDQVAALGGEYLVLLPGSYRDEAGAITESPDLDADGWRTLVETTNLLGRQIQDRFGGRITMVFHPHADTHVEYAAQVERFLDDTDPAVVSLCLDTGHYAYRDGDPLDLMRRRPERIPYLHIKTVDAALRERVQQEDLGLPQAVQLGLFKEPDQGMIDFVAFKRVLDEVEFSGYAIVEHDLYPCGFDVPLPIAKRTRAYLTSIGLG